MPIFFAKPAVVPQSLTVKTNNNTMVLSTTNNVSTLHTSALNLEVDTLKVNGDAGDAGQVLMQGLTGPYWGDVADIDSWVGTATSDLDMNEYGITNVTSLYVNGSSGSIGQVLSKDTSNAMVWQTPTLTESNGDSLANDVNIVIESNDLATPNAEDPVSKGFTTSQLYSGVEQSFAKITASTDGSSELTLGCMNAAKDFMLHGQISSSSSGFGINASGRDLYLANIQGLNINGTKGNEGTVLTSHSNAGAPTWDNPQFVSTATSDLNMRAYDISSNSYILNETGFTSTDASGNINSLTRSNGITATNLNGSTITLNPNIGSGLAGDVNGCLYRLNEAGLRMTNATSKSITLDQTNGLVSDQNAGGCFIANNTGFQSYDASGHTNSFTTNYGINTTDNNGNTITLNTQDGLIAYQDDGSNFSVSKNGIRASDASGHVISLQKNYGLELFDDNGKIITLKQYNGLTGNQTGGGGFTLNKTGFTSTDESEITNSLTKIGGLQINDGNDTLSLTASDGLNTGYGTGSRGQVLTKNASNNMVWDNTSTLDICNNLTDDVTLSTSQMDYVYWVETGDASNNIFLPTTTVLRQKITIRNDSAYTITISAQSTNTIYSVEEATTTDLVSHSALQFYCTDTTADAVNWIII